MSNAHESKFLGVDELSHYLHWSPGTIRNRICRGDPMPPHIKIGRKLLFPIAELENWLRGIPHTNESEMLLNEKLPSTGSSRVFRDGKEVR